jgi:hypothetical protein
MLQLRCVVCHQPFDFDRHDWAVVIRHIAHGYDFVHPRHESAALDWIFVDPQYDRPEFSRDERRARILDVAPPAHWAAVMPGRPEQIAAGDLFSLQPLGVWALVEYRDGSRYVEGLLREPEWETEPGGAVFPEGNAGARDAVGYAPMSDVQDQSRSARWEAIIYARNRGKHVPPCCDLPSLQFRSSARRDPYQTSVNYVHASAHSGLTVESRTVRAHNVPVSTREPGSQ